MAIVFYDTETTGIDAPFDQIVQFAAIRTDVDLKELERFEVRSRLQPHIVPAPDAMMTNRVTAARLLDPSLPSHYGMACAIHARLHSWSPAMFMGYNSLRFDEHFLRQALYQTLHPPFLTNSHGNSRSDVLRMIQAASVYAPASITIPLSDDGRPVFKLDRVAPANGFANRTPHDAMADAEATLYLCHLLCERAPELWSTFMRFSQKAAAAAFIGAESLFCVSDYYGVRAYAWLVTSLGQNEQNTSEYYVFDLSFDPAELAILPADELEARLKSAPRPVRSVRVNAAPLMMSAEDAPPFAAGKNLPESELLRRIAVLQNEPELRARLIAAFEAGRARPTALYVEQQIYDGFLSHADEAVLEAFHVAPWEQRPAIVDRLTDRRMVQLARRLLFTERPDLFPPETRGMLEQLRARRLLGDVREVPWRTLSQALFEIDGALSEAQPPGREFLVEHKEYLLACQTRANEALRDAAATQAAVRDET